MEKRKLYTILYISEGERDKNLLDNLENNGFNIAETGNEEECKRILKEKEPEVILLSIKSQEFGLRMISKIKEEDCFSIIPIIVISTFLEVKEKVELLNSGASDYIVQPFEYEELLAKINNRLINYLYYKKLVDKYEQLKEMSLVDEITGLFNKKYLEERIVAEVSRAVRKGECISFVIIETDNYDYIVNTYGQAAKNYVLKQVASMIKQLVRLSDVVIRYSERQLAVLCPITDKAGLDTFVERLRQEIQDSVFEFNGQIIKFTVSMGAYTLESSDFNSMEKKVENIIACAEEALNRAKNKSGNVIEFYE